MWKLCQLQKNNNQPLYAIRSRHQLLPRVDNPVHELMLSRKVSLFGAAKSSTMGQTIKLLHGEFNGPNSQMRLLKQPQDDDD